MVVRPAQFIERRIPVITELHAILEKTSVQLRGWDFPHLDTQVEPQIGKDWIGLEFQWAHHIEVWRFYQSGQFAHIGAYRYDWFEESGFTPPMRDWQPGAYLSIPDAVYTFSEIFEFAARLALTDAGDEHLRLFVDFKGLANRKLWIDQGDIDPVPFLRYRATIDNFPQDFSPARNTLLAESRELALNAATELFLRFGWEPSREFLKAQQSQLRWKAEGR